MPVLYTHAYVQGAMDDNVVNARAMFEQTTTTTATAANNAFKKPT